MSIWFNFFLLLVSVFALGALTFYLVQRDTSARPPTARRLGFISSLRAGDAIFLLLFSCYVILFLALALLNHATFNTGFDLAIYDNEVWNLSVGNFFDYSLIDSVNFKDYSFDPLISALVPLHAIMPDARTLLIAATIALASAAFPIYWYARSRLGYLPALAIALSFFLSPVIEYANLSNFHVIVLAVPLLSFATWFLLRQQYLPFLICALLAMLAKEEVALITTGFGIYMFVVQRKFKRGVALAIFGFLALVFILGFAYPYLTGRPYFPSRGREAFSFYGKNIWEILATLVTRPDKLLTTLSSPVKLEFVTAILFPMGFLPLAGIEVILTGLPLLMSLLISNPNFAIIELQYPSALMPSLYFAMIVGLYRIRSWVTSRWGEWTTRKQYATDAALASLVAFASVVGYVANAPGPLSDRFNATPYLLTADAISSDRLFSQIQPSAVVAVQEELLAHFSSRKSIYVFPSIPDYRLADYIVGQRGRFFFNFHEPTWNKVVSTSYFDTEETGTLVLLKRRAAEHTSHIRFGDSITVVGYSLVPIGVWQGGKIARPMIYWQASRPMDTRLSIVAEITDMQGHLWARDEHEPLDQVLPTTQWQVNQRVTDQYALKLPPTMPTGDYQLSISLHPAGTEDSLDAKDAAGNLLGTNPVVATMRVEKNKGSFPASEVDVERPLFVDMDELRLIGYAEFDDQINAGDTLPVGIYWRARVKPTRDYVVAVQLRDARGAIVAEQKGRPAMGTYGTTQWDAGEVLLDWHDLQIPSTLPDGVYAIHLLVSDAATSQTAGESVLASVSAPK